MEWVRQRRRGIMFGLGLLALLAMTYRYLERIGCDPLGGYRVEPERDGANSVGR